MQVAIPVGSSVQVTVGLVYLTSFLAKARKVDRFLTAVGDYGIFSSRTSRTIGWLVVVLEFALAVSHLTGLFLPAAVPVGAALLTSFIVAESIVLWRGGSAPCHCFGDNEKISGRSLVRSLVLLGSEFFLLFRTLPRLSGHWRGQLLSWDALSHALPWACFVIVTAMWLFSVPELNRLVRDVATSIELGRAPRRAS